MAFNITDIMLTPEPWWITHHDPDPTDCDYIHHVNLSDKCAFVNATESCHINEGIIDYTIVVYCTFRESLIPLAVTLLIGWLTVLFISLAITADDFFCPALEVMAKTMRLSDNIAGVTLLAFGNGAPDVFSAISAVANMKNNDLGMVFGALLGAGVFLTTVVAGAVCFVGPFHAMERPFLRDLIFYIVTVFVTFFICWDGEITLFETLFYFIAYIIYVVVVVVGRIVYQWQKKRRLARHALNGSSEESETTDEAEEEVRPILYSESSPVDSDGELTPLISRSVVRMHRGVFKPLLYAVSPIGIEEWKKSGCIGRIYCLIKAPALFVIKLTTPVVDYRDPPLQNWCKPLQMLQCIITPVFIIFAANADIALTKVGGVCYIWIFFVIGGCLLAILIFFTSTNDKAPPYHAVFAYVGFLAAVMWIKTIASEIVNLLQTGGLVFHISIALLGLTFLAWGNSIGDFIADVAMAKRGYPRTGISACFGGPLFNTLLGIGIPFTRKVLTDGKPVMVKLTNIQMILFGGVGVSLIFSLIVVPLIKFRLNRIYGLILVLLYALFLTVAILVETEVIHWD